MSEESLKTGKNEELERAPLARGIAMIVVVLSTALLLVGLYPNVVSGEVPEYGFYLHVTAIVYLFLGALIVYHQPRNTVGWLVLLLGFLAALSRLPIGVDDIVNNFDSTLARTTVVLIGELTWILPMFVPITLILQFYPDGRLPSPRWRGLTILTVFSIVLMAIQMAAISWSAFEQGVFDPDNPPQAEGILRLLEIVAGGLFVIALVGSVASLIFRFRRSRGVERLQIKWLVYTAVVFAILSLLAPIIFGEESPVTAFFFSSFAIWLAFAMGIAILRYRLYDIDIIIRRTLQYGLLTAVLAAIYFGIVLFVQSTFVALTGQESPIAIVISTLVIAALFNPLRKRLQAFIDRRFYRKSYDSALTLQQFAQAARDEVDLEQLTAELVNVVKETMQPEIVSMWLKSSTLIFPETGEVQGGTE